MTADRARVITVLGGSSAFTPALAHALAAAAPGLPPLELRLVGRDPRRTADVARFCQALASAVGAPHTYRATTVLADGARGAAVVLNQMRVGGFAGRTHDDTFPLAHGLPGDETIGPGGLASALRSLPAVLAAARTVAAVAERPWFVNLTNPLGILVRALETVAGIRAFGLCELPGAVLARTLALVGRARAEVDVDYFGLNHQGWFTRIERGGVDLLPELLAAVAREPGEALLQRSLLAACGHGALPLPYLRLYADPAGAVAEARARRQPRGEQLAALAQTLHAHYAAWRPGQPAELPASLRQRELPWLSAAVVPCLLALLADVPHELYLTGRNDGVYQDLPADATVERRCLLAAYGAEPYPLRRAPPRPLVAMLQQIVEFERRALLAAQRGSAEAVIAALAAHPFGIGAGTAGALVAPILQELA